MSNKTEKQMARQLAKLKQFLSDANARAYASEARARSYAAEAAEAQSWAAFLEMEAQRLMRFAPKVERVDLEGLLKRHKMRQ